MNHISEAAHKIIRELILEECLEAGLVARKELGEATHATQAPRSGPNQVEMNADR